MHCTQQHTIENRVYDKYEMKWWSENKETLSSTCQAFDVSAMFLKQIL